MKKLLLASSIVLSTWFTSHAAVALAWNNITGTVLDSSNNAAPSTWLTQLIWTPTAVADAVSSTTPLVPTGDDVLIHSQPINTFNFNGAIVGANPDLADSRAGGFVYTRVFNIDFGSSSTPTLYGQSTNFGGRQGTNGATALTITTNDPSTSNDHDPLGIVVNQSIAVVPEPATYAFLGIGAVFFGLRRFRAKR